jgi:hypothetical protein
MQRLRFAIVVVPRKCSNHKANNTRKFGPYGGTKGKMLTSRKWRRAVQWMFACFRTSQIAVHVMFCVPRDIHRRDDLVVTETAAGWCLS